MTEVATTTTETMERAWKELERHKVWMLTTRGSEGFHARPMHAVPSRAEHCIWFVSDRGGVKDEEIARENHVGLTTCDGNFYMAVAGTAEVVEDRTKMQEIWSTPMQAYFPRGRSTRAPAWSRSRRPGPSSGTAATRLSASSRWSPPSSRRSAPTSAITRRRACNGSHGRGRPRRNRDERRGGTGRVHPGQHRAAGAAARPRDQAPPRPRVAADLAEDEEVLGGLNVPPPYGRSRGPAARPSPATSWTTRARVRPSRARPRVRLRAGAIAAVKAGAGDVVANDIDAVALTAMRLNAEANAVAFRVTAEDLLDDARCEFDVVLVGDLFYERRSPRACWPTSRRQRRAGALVLIGDPRRNYFPRSASPWRRATTCRSRSTWRTR